MQMPRGYIPDWGRLSLPLFIKTYFQFPPRHRRWVRYIPAEPRATLPNFAEASRRLPLILSASFPLLSTPFLYLSYPPLLFLLSPPIILPFHSLLFCFSPTDSLILSLTPSTYSSLILYSPNPSELTPTSYLVFLPLVSWFSLSPYSFPLILPLPLPLPSPHILPPPLNLPFHSPSPASSLTPLSSVSSPLGHAVQ